MTRLSIDKKYLAKAILLILILVALYVTSIGVPGTITPQVTLISYKYGKGWGLLAQAAFFIAAAAIAVAGAMTGNVALAALAIHVLSFYAIPI